MICHRWTNRVCAVATLLALLVTVLFLNGDALGIARMGEEPLYAKRLFAPDRVHTLDIQLAPEAWELLLENGLDEEYVPCTAIIDGEAFPQVGLRTKGNNSKNLTHKYGLSRYSLKLKFDRYVDGMSYHGLEKLSLNSSFQDNAYLKDYITYDMMRHMQVPAPLVSYVFVTVNGEDWGLFVAVEEMEGAFARRSFGKDHGLLYKPDYQRLEDENPDVALRYTTEDPADYDGIFRNAKFEITGADQRRLIAALKQVASGENLDKVLNTDGLLRYFVVQVFVVNYDSYLGPTGHNYYLYEKDGVLSMLPWDYNLAYGTYALGMRNPIHDPTVIINTPIDTPFAGDVMLQRPLYHEVMKQDEYFAQYHQLFNVFLAGYIENGLLAERVIRVREMIAPYVRRDPTKNCTYDEFLTAIDTFLAFCDLRAQSTRGQLAGLLPSTFAQQKERPDAYIDASSLRIEDFGTVADLKTKAAQ